MGGGNAQKTAMARAKKQAASKASSGSQLKQNAAAMSKMCNVCKQTFHITSKRPLLEQHVDSKHSKLTFKDCFPNEA